MSKPLQGKDRWASLGKNKVNRTSEASLDEKQSLAVAQAIGIEVSEILKYRWVFEEMHKLELPKATKRCLGDKQDKIVYINEQTGVRSAQHPYLHILKNYFYDVIADTKRVYTFQDKLRKLLPYVEERMLRQGQSFFSKRRDAQKVNMQKDDKGKVTLNKLQRMPPDLGSLMAGRSYMLKMLVQKVFTKKQLWGKGKRINAFANILNDYKASQKVHSPDKEEDIAEQQLDLKRSHIIYNDAAVFYNRRFGNIKDVPSEILQLVLYRKCTPESIYRNIQVLNLSKNNVELYWLARLMACLPLPTDWKQMADDKSVDSFMYVPQQLTFSIHPSYIYVVEQMNRFRTSFAAMSFEQQTHYLAMRLMEFTDDLQRTYTVDIYAYIEKKDISEEHATRKTKPGKENEVSDWLILEAMSNVSVSQENYELIDDIDIFWMSLDFKDEPWTPSINPFGEVNWSSTVTNTSIYWFPYQQQLHLLLRSKLAARPQISQRDLKIQYREGAKDRAVNLKVQQACSKEREKFIKCMLSNNTLSRHQPEVIISQEQFFEQVFTSPFSLDEGVQKDGPVPLWLQKCRAKQNTLENQRMLTFLPEQYERVKSSFCSDALQTAIHQEPYYFEEIKQKIADIGTIQQLKQFIKIFNDVDEREERKRKWEIKGGRQEEDVQSGVELTDTVEEEETRQNVLDLLEYHRQIETKGLKGKKQEKTVDAVDEAQQEEQDQYSESKQQSFGEKHENEEIQEAKIVTEKTNNYQSEKHLSIRQQLYSSLQLLEEPQLDKLLYQTANEQLRQSKFQAQHVRRSSEQRARQALRLMEQRNCEQIKRSLLASKLRTRNFTDLQRGLILSNNVTSYRTAAGYSRDCQISAFNSECSSYGNAEVCQIIVQRKAKRAEQMMRGLGQKDFNPEKEQIELKQDTVWLQTIKQMKPDILRDPVLKYVKEVTAPEGFSEVFSRDTRSKQLMLPKGSLPLFTGVEKINSIVSSARITSQRQLFSGDERRRSISPRKMPNETSKNSLTSRQKHERPFRRVCLGSTGSHLLGKEALLRKGDLITLEAQKSLVAKGRGLNTFLSKKY